MISYGQKSEDHKKGIDDNALAIKRIEQHFCEIFN